MKDEGKRKDKSDQGDSMAIIRHIKESDEQRFQTKSQQPI